MDNKGFTLIELLVTLVIIAIVMGIVISSSTRVSIENKNKIYEEYLRMMEEYALVSEHKGESIITLSQLDNLGKIKNDCKFDNKYYGYVVLISSNPIKYQAHLKCGTWTSPSGFDESLIS